MKRIIQNALDQIVEVVRGWEGSDTLTRMENSNDFYDPYFFVSLDLYYRGSIPGSAERGDMFSFAGGFESAGFNRKDRFLVGEVPFRLEYKNIDRFESIISDSRKDSVYLRDSGTYMFHRLKTAGVIFSSSDWIETARVHLDQLSDEFWSGARRSAQATMEHFLGDMSAAVIREDPLFFLISASGFVKSALRTLFAINRIFEPSPRQFNETALELPVLPDSFRGMLDSFIRPEELSLSRKREISELMAKRIIQL